MKSKLYIVIEADTNDGDYITEIAEISQKELEQIEPVFKAIKKQKQRHNWPTFEGRRSEEKSPYELYVDSGLITEKQYDIFNEFVPHGEWGIHTIESIKVFEVVNEKNYL